MYPRKSNVAPITTSHLNKSGNFFFKFANFFVSPTLLYENSLSITLYTMKRFSYYAIISFLSK